MTLSRPTDLLRRLAVLYPREVPPDDDVDRALCFLGVDEESTVVVRAGNGAAVVVLGVSVVAAALVPASIRLPIVGALVALALAAPPAVRRVPVALAAVERTRALGDAPALVARAALRMRIEPTPEAAAAFAARTGDGPLAASLDDHVRRAVGSPSSGLTAFAAEWEAWNPALHRAMSLVSAAGEAPAAERDRTLDRALTAVLDGTRERMAEFVARIREPATAVYAFGVLLPLALVAVLPAARAAGVPASPVLIIAVYDFLLPAALLAASAWLLVRRPVAFPPPEVTAAHPDVPNRRWPVVIAGLLAGGLALFVSGALFPRWTRWVAFAGCTVGTVLVGVTRPTVRVRNRVRAVEANVTDALYLVGRRVNEGTAVEAAVAAAADEVPGETGAVFEQAARVQRRLRVSVRESFLGEYGALSDVPSPRARSAVALLALAAREGRPAGSAVLAMADHVDDLQRVEREARRELAQVTGTLRHTAAMFGPLVSGATVALAGGMAGRTSFGGAFPVDILGLAVGAYVLFLSAIVTTLGVGLEHGLDRTLVGYRVGRSTLAATGVYLLSFALAGTLT